MDTARAIARTFAGLLLIALSIVPSARAADVSLNVSISPEVAAMVRQWRRDHGLPQADEAPQSKAEAAAHLQAARAGAVDKALRLVGLDAGSAQGFAVAAERVGTHWQVSIKREGDADEAGYLVEVADAVASRSHALAR